MKAKKALKRLAKAESLLTGVLDQYPAEADGWRELLGAAKQSVSQARAAIGAEKAPAAAKPNRLSEDGRKRISEAAKKRWAAARRKGVSAVTGQKLRRTA